MGWVHSRSTQQSHPWDCKALRRHHPGPTVVTSHQQIPNSTSRIAIVFCTFMYFLFRHVGFGGKIPAVTGKAPFELGFSGAFGRTLFQWFIPRYVRFQMLALLPFHGKF